MNTPPSRVKSVKSQQNMRTLVVLVRVFQKAAQAYDGMMIARDILGTQLNTTCYALSLPRRWFLMG